MNPRRRRALAWEGFATPVLSTLSVCLLLGLAACSALRPDPNPFKAASGEALVVHVEVVNSNAYDAIVWIRGSALRRRIGTVPGNDDRRFTVDWSAVDQLSFEADLQGGGRCTTREIPVRAGEVVRLDIDSMPLGRADGKKSMCDVRRWR